MDKHMEIIGAWCKVLATKDQRAIWRIQIRRCPRRGRGLGVLLLRQRRDVGDALRDGVSHLFFGASFSIARWLERRDFYDMHAIRIFLSGMHGICMHVKNPKRKPACVQVIQRSSCRCPSPAHKSAEAHAH